MSGGRSSSSQGGGAIEVVLGIIVWGILMAMVLHSCGIG